MTKDTLTISITHTPVDAGLDQSICFGDQITLSGIGATTLNWTNGITDGVPFTPLDTTMYILVGVTNGCIGRDTVLVFVNPLPTVDAGISQSICEGNQITLNGFGANSYVWDNGIVNGTPFTPISTTTYEVIGADGNNCTDTSQVTVTVNSSPFVNIQPSVLFGNAPLIVSFGNGSTINHSYIWNFGNGDTSFLFLPTNITYENTGSYLVSLTVTDPITGCLSSEEVIIEVRGELSIIIPTVFTPNGDGVNDIFNAVPENAVSYSMMVFNRWGSSVF